MPNLAVAVLIAVAGCFVPPSQTNIGSTALQHRAGRAIGPRVTTGAHLASGKLADSVPIDVGVGYIYQRLGASTAPSLARARSTPTTDVRHGIYLHAAHRLHAGARDRSWLGGRASGFIASDRDDTRLSLEITGRVSWELFHKAYTEHHRRFKCHRGRGWSIAVTRGASAIGVFVESGLHMSDSQRAWVATAGVTARLPLAGVAGYSSCKRR